MKDRVKWMVTKIKENIALIISLISILLLSYATIHGDVVVISALAHRVYSGNFNFYEPIWGTVPVTPPLAYVLDSLNYSLFRVLHLISFDPGDWSNITSFESLQIKFRYVAVLLISFHFIKKAAFAYTNGDKKLTKLIGNLWILSPLVIFSPFAQGNNDIYPVTLLIIFLYFAFKKNYMVAMLMLGFAAATKNFALFLFIPTAIIFSQKRLDKTFIYLAIAAFAYVLPVFFFISEAKSFLASGGEGLFIFQKTLTEEVLLFPALYILINLYLYFKEDLTDQKKLSSLLVKYLFITMSLFYVASFFIPQWFLWISPLFIFLVYKNKKLFYVYILLNIAYFVLLIINWGKNLDMYLFQNPFPIVMQMPSIYDFLSSSMSGFRIDVGVTTIFVSIYLFFVYLLLKPDKKEESINLKMIYLSLLPLFIYLMINLVYAVGYFKFVNIKIVNVESIKSLTENIQQISEKKYFTQTFISRENNLSGIQFYTGTYMQYLPSKYNFKLYQEDCSTLVYNVDLSTIKMRDNALLSVKFPKIPDSEDKSYCFTLEPIDSTVDRPITLYVTSNDYKNGKLTLKGQEMDDDIYFQLLYPLH